MLLVNKYLPGITLFNADSHEQLCQAATGIYPHEAAFSRDGKYIYVPIYGSSGVGKPGTGEHTIHVFRASDCSEAGRIDTGEYKRLHGIATGVSGKVYVTAEAAEAIIILDGNPQPGIVGAIPTGSKTSHMFAMTRDERRAYVSNVQSQTISVLDVPNRRLLATVPTEGENQRMTLSPDEKLFVTSVGPSRKIAFYRTADHQLDFDIPIDGTPFVGKFSRDGKFFCNAGFTAHGQLGAWKIDVLKREVVASIADGLGHDPGSLEVNPYSGNVYISDQPGRKINIVDPTTWRLITVFATAPAPDAMAFFPSISR